MIEVLSICILFITIGCISWGLKDTRRMAEAPFLYGMGLYAITCFQIISLIAMPERVDQGAFAFTLFLVVTMSGLFLWGYFAGKNHSNKKSKFQSFRDKGKIRIFRLNETKAKYTVYILAILGLVGTYKFQTAPRDDMSPDGLMRGWLVYWYTLSTLVNVALALSAYLGIKFGKWHYWLLVIVLAAPIIYFRIYSGGRRSEMLVLPMLILIPLILGKRLRIPRLVPIVGLLLVPIIVYVVPAWRSDFKEGRHVEAIKRSGPLETLRGKILEYNDDSVELADTSHVVGACLETMRFDAGSGFYNEVVKQLVPGTLLGRDFKENLMIENKDIAYDVMIIYDREIPFYTSKAIYSDLFMQFSFLALPFMFGLGWFYGQAYHKAYTMQDARWILFMLFFGFYPAAFPYGALTITVGISVFAIGILLFLVANAVKRVTIFPPRTKKVWLLNQ